MHRRTALGCESSAGPCNRTDATCDRTDTTGQMQRLHDAKRRSVDVYCRHVEAAVLHQAARVRRPSQRQAVHGVSSTTPVPVQTWAGVAQSRRRCGALPTSTPPTIGETCVATPPSRSLSQTNNLTSINRTPAANEKQQHISMYYIYTYRSIDT